MCISPHIASIEDTLSKEPYVYDKRALYVYHHRPRLSKTLCQKNPMHISKEPYVYITTDRV